MLFLGVLKREPNGHAIKKTWKKGNDKQPQMKIPDFDLIVTHKKCMQKYGKLNG